MESFIKTCLVQMAKSVEVFHGSLLAIIAYSDGAANADRTYSPGAPPTAQHSERALITEESSCVLEFTEKEIERMPKQFRQYFSYGGKRRKIARRKNGVYEIRACIHGVKISARSISREVAVKKFTESLKAFAAGICKEQKKSPTLFEDFATEWLERIKRPALKELSFNDLSVQFRAHLLPAFAGRKISELHPMELREFVGKYIEEGHVRIALKLYTTLNEFFDCAVGEELISKNPMKSVPKPKYNPKARTILTKEEETSLLQRMFLDEHPLRYAIVFLLYTGMRRSELKNATTDGVWITTITTKTRKGCDVKKRRIPISPMLRPYMDQFNKENIGFPEDRLSRVIPKYLPNHNLHELRHTFITRTQECGVPKPVVKLWVGHTSNKNDMTEAVYTHFSDEFQLAEIAKIKY